MSRGRISKKCLNTLSGGHRFRLLCAGLVDDGHMTEVLIPFRVVIDSDTRDTASSRCVTMVLIPFRVVIDSDKRTFRQIVSAGPLTVLIPFRVVIDSDSRSSTRSIPRRLCLNTLSGGHRFRPPACWHPSRPECVLIPFRVVIDSDAIQSARPLPHLHRLNTLSGGHRFRHRAAAPCRARPGDVLIPFRVVIDSDRLASCASSPR